jgi:hypothetical protein
MAIKIPVDADISGVQKKIQELSRTIEKASRIKWTPVDSQLIARETQNVERTINEFYRRTGAPSGAAGRGSGGARPSSAQPGGSGGGYRRDSGPAIGDIGRQFAGSVGGGFGTISSYASRGFQSGYWDAPAGGGGMAGGMAGLLRGGLIGASVFAAAKIGSSVNEGYDMSKDRALGLDTLKRQMGDIGISFDRLKEVSDRLSDGLGVNSQEFVKLEANMQRLSRSSESPLSLAEQTAFGVGVSRSYGLEAGAAGGFFGGMRNVDQRANNRELAVILADTVARSGMNARADEVMQAILGFANTTSRLSLSSPNSGAFGAAYSSLMGTKLPGMTGDAAAGILMQANAGITGMGSGAGEAGYNFMLSAFNRNGRINPLQAEALAAQGLFGTRAGAFGAGSPIAGYLGHPEGLAMGRGAGANVTNLDAVRAQFDRMGHNMFTLQGAQRVLGLSSPEQAAALLNMSSSQSGGLGELIKSNHLDINKMSASGISRLGSIAAAGTDKNQLSAIFNDMKASHLLTTDETKSLSAAEKGSPQQFRDTLIAISSMKDQAVDQGEQLRNISASLDNVKINTGDKLLTPINAMSDAIVAGSGRTPMQNRQRVINMQYDDAIAGNKEAENANSQQILRRHLPLSDRMAALEAQHSLAEQANNALEVQRHQALSGAHSPYEINITNNVNVKDSQGNVSSSSTRANLGAPQPSGSKSVTIGTH